MTLSKNCLVCGNIFYKKQNQSLNTWNNISKYCSKNCQIIGVGKVAGPRIAALNVSRTGQRKQYSQNWYKENKDRLSAEAKIKYQERKQEILARRKELMKFETEEHRKKRLAYHIEYRKAHLEKNHLRGQTIASKFKMYISSAGRRNHSFELSFEEFVVLFNGFCNYCGKENSRGIDRIDNKIGYTKENSVPCCSVCNKMKIHYSKEFFMEHISKIYKYLIK
jgi:hypothetical protein